MRAKKIEILKNEGIDSIYRLACRHVEISGAEWEQCRGMFASAFFSRKQMLVNRGEVCGKIFFVASGLLRIYFTDEKGEEKTFHFCMENTFATDYESFLKGVPSSFSIQAVEDSVVLLVSREMLESLYSLLGEGQKLGRLIAEDYFFILNEKIKSIYVNSPMERYKAMNMRFPNLLQRVPQYHIASYLNISPVHLSRLKLAERENSPNG
ncbi:Crp/Fnr family transcriptional regulator [Flavobacterium sp. HJSW_4]|uniref:Crp/Fnr family transcriptional regulator n=1 Tax=Flavobacterium sp. HJSW_4 TaxID=3344660 RepID=UPI0035F45C6D